MFPGFFISKVAAAGWIEQAILTASDGQSDDRFGQSVAIDNDTVVVGAFYEDGAGINRGAAYVYTRSGVTWTEQAKLVASDPENESFFGFSVAISGDTIVVGASGQDNFGLNRGAAYVFTRAGTVWTQEQKLVAGDQANNDLFGNAVAIDGDTIVVGARLEDDVGLNRGAAYVFYKSGGVWSQQAKLLASDAADSDQFGYSVAIYGETVSVGAYLKDEGGTDRGAVYVFTRSGVTWTQEAKLVPSDPSNFDFFGSALSLYIDTLLIGASGKNSAAGAAYTFTRAGVTWTEQQKLTASDGAANDSFGGSVGLYDDLIIIGARAKDEGGIDRGAAYVFTLSGGTWTQNAKLVASDTADNEYFGTAVGVYDDTIAVSANLRDDLGATYIFVPG